MKENFRKGLLIRALEGKGEVLTILGNYDNAINSFEMLVNYSENSNLQLSRAKRNISTIFILKGNLKNALKLADEANSILKEDSIEEQIEKIEILTLYSWIYRIEGFLEKCLRKNKEGLEMIDKISSSVVCEKKKSHLKRLTAEIFGNLGLIFRAKGEYNKALEHYQKSLSIFEEIDNKSGIAIVYANLGVLYSDEGEYDKSIEFYQKSLRIFEEIGDKRSIGLINGSLGIVYQNKGEYDKALDLFQKKLSISEMIGDIRSIGFVRGNLGVIYQNKGEYNKSIMEYEKSLKIFEAINDKKSIGMTLGNIGSLYLEMGRLKKAELFLSSAEKILNDYKDKYYLPEILANIAELKIRKSATGSFIKQALDYIQRALKIAYETELKEDIAKILIIKGLIEIKEMMEKMVNETKWEDNFIEAINIFQELNQPFWEAKAYYYYGEALMIRGEKERANEYLQKAQGIFEKITSKMYVKKVKSIILKRFY